MDNIFYNNNFNRGILSILLTTFTLTCIVPAHAVFQQYSMGVNDIAFLYRIEKLVEKVWKLEKSDNKDKMYDAIIDLKSEIEAYYGVKIDINKNMDNLEKQLKQNDINPSEKQFDAIRSAIKKKEKKHKKHKKYLASVMNLDGYEINGFDEDVMFPEYSINNIYGKKDDNSDKEEVNVPAQLVFGVTLTLCGMFLMVIPVPVVKPWAERMIASGVVICGNCICGKLDNDKKEE